METDKIACPVCDVIYHIPVGASRACCKRCHYRLSFGTPEAIGRVVGLAVTSVILLGLVLVLPFLNLKAGPFGSEATVIDAALGFKGSLMAPLSIAVLCFIIILPLLRFLLVIYALFPLMIGWANFPGAKPALRWAIKLKPWAMAEVFLIGVGVTLVKLLDMASVSPGPAFWALCAVVVLAAFQDTLMCRNTLWTSLDQNHR